jgi:hypothetical protein
VLIAASARLGWLVTSLALLGSSGPVPWTLPARFAAVVEDITPESANDARFGIEQQGQQLSASGEHQRAAELYWQKGIELKDPVLIIDAGEAWREHARSQRSIEAAQTAITQIQVALDMLYFLRDGATSSAWQPVAPEHVGRLIERAQTVVSDAQALIAEIEEEQRRAAEAAAAPVEEPQKKRGPAKPGTGLIIGGSAALVVGLGGAGLAAAGLALGAQAQSEVEDPLVYEPEHSAAEARGRSANVLAGVGMGVGAVGVGVGVALIVLGVKKRQQAGSASAKLLPVPMIGPSGGGFGLAGRF